jgi:hypothetical protein
MFILRRRSAPLGLVGWCLASAWLASSPAFAAPSAARLSSADPAGVRFVVDVPEIALTAAPEDSTLSTLAIEGFDSDGRPGTAALPMLVVSVAVPPSGPVTVGAIGSAEETRSGIRLQALPWLARARSPEAASTSSGAALAEPASAAPLARLLDVSWMRDQRVARIAITPAAWQPARGTLTVRHRIEVEVRFDAVPAGSTPRTDAFEGVYRDALLNYEQGRSWRRPAGGARASVSRSTTSGARTAAAAAVVPDTSLYAGRLWVKVAIPSTGFYKVEFAQLLNTKLFGGRRDRPTEWVRVFTWPGVPVLPEDSYCDSCGYRELAIQFVEFPKTNTIPPKDNKDFVLDDNREYFYFYALGPSDWGSLYDASKRETTFVNHPYDTRNFVYVTLDSTHSLPGDTLRIQTASAGLSLDDTLTTPTPASFPAREHVEVDDGSQYWPDASPVVGRNLDGTYRYSGQAWEKFFWTSMTAPGGTLQSFDLPGVDLSAPLRVRVRAWGLSSLVPGLDKTFGFPDHSLDVQVGSVLFPNRTWNGLTSQTFDTTAAGSQFAESQNVLKLNVPKLPDPNPRHFDRIGLAWLEAYYRRRFVPAANSELTFDSEPAGGTWLYRIGPFSGPSASSPPRVFDVTDPLQPIELMGSLYHSLSASSWELLFKRTESGQRRYRIVPDASFVKPPTANVFDAPNSSRQNLRRLLDRDGHATGADFLLVYFDGFRAAADTLLRWRHEHLPAMSTVAPFDTFSVPISAIYDQFSGGRTDPAAIRNFLRAAFTYWDPRPTYVTILGDDSYDTKNLTGQAPAGMPGTLVPSYENGYDDLVQRQFATDDWLLNVDDPKLVIPDFLGGRIPAGDADEAIRYVRDKLLPYERAAPLGEWRDRVMLIADDNLIGSGEPDPIRWGHLDQTATLDREGLPPEFDRRYVYLHTYPDGSNHTKPLAKADIVNGLNEGVVLANFIGHGSPYQLTDEAVFQTLDAKALTNKSRQTIFIAASCDVGKFNNPAAQSLGELLLLNPNGGAVAVVSATELAISNLNANLNLQLFQHLFSRDTTTGQRETPLSLALLASKTGIANNQKYQVMGDAAVKPALPRYYVETALQNDQTQPDSVAERGETMLVTGRLLDRPGGSLLTYDGTCRVSIEDSAPVDTILPSSITYPFRAAPVFRGDVAIQGGTFSIHFVTPMNAVLGPRARVRLYDELTQGAFVSDGVGSKGFTIAPGTPPANDHEGPRITLGFRGGATSVRPDAELRVDLYDQSGILITGHTQQNGIIVTLDEDSNRRADITSTFRYGSNSYQSGSASFVLPGLTPGPHRIRVSAADNLAAGISAPDHRSSATLDFEVTQSPVLKVTRAILFPNPVRSGGLAGGGQFVIDAPGDSVNVLLRIYTVAGRLVRSLESNGGLAQVQIPWDGLDAEGEALARGIYLFKAQVYPRDLAGKSTGQGRAEAEGKLVVVGR